MSDVQDTATASAAKPISTNTSTTKSKPPQKKKKPEISDSWEDDAENLSSSESEPDTPTASSSSQPPAPPPPTPATPSFLSPGVRSPYSTSTFDQRHNIDRGANEPRDRAGSLSDNRENIVGGGVGGGGGRERAVTYSDRQTEDERQLKTDAVARRMIANALGVKSRSTAEQKEYENSLKAKVRSEREERRKAEEEMEKAKKAIWDD